MASKKIRQRLEEFRKQGGASSASDGEHTATLDNPSPGKATWDSQQPSKPALMPSRLTHKRKESARPQHDDDRPSWVGRQKARLRQRIRIASWLDVTLFLFLWVLVQALFVYGGFGVVFFIISALFAMYLSTEDNAHLRRRGEKSAYSVFNENCEAIDGSLDANALDKQLRYGPMAPM